MSFNPKMIKFESMEDGAAYEQKLKKELADRETVKQQMADNQRKIEDLQKENEKLQRKLASRIL